MKKKIFRKRKRVRFPWREKQTYIVPTRYGFTYLLSFLLMVLAGATYSNNMVFILAFILFSLGLIAMIQTHRNLIGISIVSLRVEPGFSGEHSQIFVQLKNNSKHPRCNVRTQLLHLPVTVDTEFVLNHDTAIGNAQVQMGPRGHYTIERVKISTVFPYGLFYAWQYQNTSAEFCIYPQPKGEPLKRISRSGQGEDFSGHHLYSEGDSQKHIDWKAHARGRPLLVKNFKEGHPNVYFFNLPSEKTPSIETELSQICLWLVESHQNRYEFGLKFENGKTLSAGQGVSHLHRCLKALANYEAA